MAEGDVYFWKKFEFPDGGRADKLLIVLNNTDLCDFSNVLLFKTTSKQWRRQSREGCNDGYFFFSRGKELFPMDTWILFTVYEVTFGDLLKTKSDNSIEFKGTLKNKSLAALLDCASKSNDISGHHMDVINCMRQILKQ